MPTKEEYWRNPEKWRARSREYADSHPEWKRESGAAWMRKKRASMSKEELHEARFKKAKQDPIGHMLRVAKKRAAKFGVPFSITREDLVMPEVCPVFGTPWERVPGRMGWANRVAPTIDRIKPHLGYVPGNVGIISVRANRLKSDASLEELEALVAYVKGGPVLDQRVGW